MRIKRSHLFGLAVLLLTAAPARAQEPAPAVDSAAVIQAGEPRLVFEREVYNYPGRARRDPFMPLTGANAGPLFSDLKLRGIIYSDNPSESIVAVSDATDKVYRLRRGESVGSVTVVDIGRTRVVFSVNDFGVRKQQVLDLKEQREGATR